jgi:sugar phosphate isomerase/epimerase
MRPFALSCTTCSTRGIVRDEILACFEHAPKAGYRYWGLAGPPLWDLGGARWFDWQSVKRGADAAGFIGITEVYGPQFPTESADAAIAAAADIGLMFDLAANLKSPLVVITGGSRRSADFLGSTIAGIRRLLAVLPDNDVRLALEPHFLTALERRSDFDAVFDAIDDPRVGITVDTGHFHMAREDWKGIIRDYADRIYNVHVKDHVQYVSVPLGAGEIDLHAMVEELAGIGYAGALAVELEVADPQNLPQYVGESRELLARIVRDVTGADPE